VINNLSQEQYLRVAEGVLCFVVIWFFITQIIIPGFCGTKSFPIFKKEASLKTKILYLCLTTMIFKF
jgi:hypothetical protein